MKKLRLLQSGQGLIELIVGISLVSVALISAVLLTTRSIQNSDVSRKQQEALALAKKSSEMIRKMRTDMLWSDFVNIDSDEFAATLDNASADNPYKIILPDGFVRSMDIANIGNPSVGKKITVFIIWSDVKGDHTVDLATNFYN